MIIVDLASGFGNQLFQYAAGLALQRATSHPLHLNRSRGNIHGTRDYREYFTNNTYGQDITDTEVKGAIWDAKKIPFKEWNPTSIRMPPKLLLRGYYQYYPAIAPIILQLRSSLFGQLKKFSKPLQKAAFIHVRRGDYLNPQYKLPVQTKEYFEQGITYVESKKVITKWMMVSDDIEWCKSQQWSKPLEFIDEKDEVRLFWWMVHWAEAAVISNSTYSWWAALLGAHQEGSPIVYPKVWHLEHKPNLFPQEWKAL